MAVPGSRANDHGAGRAGDDYGASPVCQASDVLRDAARLDAAPSVDRSDWRAVLAARRPPRRVATDTKLVLLGTAGGAVANSDGMLVTVAPNALKQPALLDTLRGGDGYMRVPQTPLTAVTACASASIAFAEVAPQMLFDYPGYQRPRLMLWAAGDGGLQERAGRQGHRQGIRRREHDQRLRAAVQRQEERGRSTDQPRVHPRQRGATQTPWICAVCRVTTASSALKTTSRSTIRAYARRERTRSATRAR